MIFFNIPSTQIFLDILTVTFWLSKRKKTQLGLAKLNALLANVFKLAWLYFMKLC